MRVTLTVVLTSALATLVAACDPCSGISGCSTPPHVAVTGQLLDDSTGVPEAGATITLVRRQGVGLASDSVETHTDRNGLFTIDVDASGDGRDTVDIIVAPRNGTAYRAYGIPLSTTRRGGEAAVLPPWTTVPHLTDYIELRRRGGDEQVLANTQIEFQPTSGVQVLGLTNGKFRVKSDANGLTPLFGDRRRPVDAGVVVGDLTIFLPPELGSSSTHYGISVTASPEFRYGARIIRYYAGPSLSYKFIVKKRSQPDVVVPGSRVDFVRTGGIGITPSSWHLTTDGKGEVVFPAQADSVGTVTGTVTITPPAPWNPYVFDIQLATFDSDSVPEAGTFRVGPWFPYYAIIRENGVPLDSVKVEFVRDSGIAVSPDTLVTASDDSGYVFTSIEPKAIGDVYMDVRVTPPAPYSPFIVRSIHLQSVDADVPSGRTLIGDWDVAHPPTP
jgi:hypothetical protein